MAFLRRVVTGHDEQGRATIVSDGVPPKTVESLEAGAGVSEVLSFDGPPKTADDGGDNGDLSFPLEPPPGGATVRIIRLAPPPAGASAADQWLRVRGEDPDRPGWHTTATLDVEVILDGEIVLELDDGEHHLRAGDAVVQRGTGHRWRVVGDRPCTYLALMLAPEDTAPAPAPVVGRAGEDATGGIRRLVTGTGPDGRSSAVLDGPPPVLFRPPGGVLLADLWQTGGPLTDVGQGGDAGGWELEPIGRGISARIVELPAHSDPGDAGWHTTETIDVDVVMSGRLQLELPGVDPVVLGPGDVVIQRGTNHRWLAVGDEPVRWAAIMFGLRP